MEIFIKMANKALKKNPHISDSTSTYPYKPMNGGKSKYLKNNDPIAVLESKVARWAKTAISKYNQYTRTKKK